MPSAVLLYDLGRATHRDDDYRIILSAVWQTVLRSNQRPRVVLKTLMVLEAVLINGPDRALEETIDMKVRPRHVPPLPPPFPLLPLLTPRHPVSLDRHEDGHQGAPGLLPLRLQRGGQGAAEGRRHHHVTPQI